MESNPVEKESSISTIDDSLSRLNSRLGGLLGNLKTATRGEQPECDSKDELKAMPSPSIDSISQRLSNAHETLDVLERFMQRFHS